MCIVAFAWKAHPKWQLVAIGNRDELHARPAEAAHRWDEPGHMLAGRDVLAGGTWLGISELGRFAVVTNLYGFGPPDPEAEASAIPPDGKLLGEDQGDEIRVFKGRFGPYVQRGPVTVQPDYRGAGRGPGPQQPARPVHACSRARDSRTIEWRHPPPLAQVATAQRRAGDVDSRGSG